ncbi:MAG: hypothetical protein WC538_21130 [Thermoanaerobaculia bacterium]
MENEQEKKEEIGKPPAGRGKEASYIINKLSLERLIRDRFPDNGDWTSRAPRKASRRKNISNAIGGKTASSSEETVNDLAVLLRCNKFDFSYQKPPLDMVHEISGALDSRPLSETLRDSAINLPEEFITRHIRLRRYSFDPAKPLIEHFQVDSDLDNRKYVLFHLKPRTAVFDAVISVVAPLNSREPDNALVVDFGFLHVEDGEVWAEDIHGRTVLHKPVTTNGIRLAMYYHNSRVERIIRSGQDFSIQRTSSMPLEDGDVALEREADVVGFRAKGIFFPEPRPWHPSRRKMLGK